MFSVQITRQIEWMLRVLSFDRLAVRLQPQCCRAPIYVFSRDTAPTSHALSSKYQPSALVIHDTHQRPTNKGSQFEPSARDLLCTA